MTSPPFPHKIILLFQPTSLLCPWDSPGKNIGVGCYFLLHEIFPTQELNLGLLHSLVAHMVKHLPTMWEIWVQSLGQGDLLEKEMATYSSILAWKIPWTEESGRLQFMGLQRIGHD